MKVNASLLSRIAESPREFYYAQKLAARTEPGQSIAFADGSRLRVHQKSASPDGLRFVVSGQDGVKSAISIRQFASLGPVSPAMSRLASFVHRVVAFDATIDSYVKEAIKAAGYPVDPSMNWAKYLDRMYSPLLKNLTEDTDLMDDAIRDTVIEELYQKNILSPHSTYAHFDPKHEALVGKELANKVSAYLVTIFKHRKEEVVNYVKRALGVGSAGNMGLVPTESLDQPGGGDGSDDDLSNDLGSIVKPETNKDIENMEGEDEVRAFLDAFRAFVKETNRENTAKTLNFITSCFEAGLDRSVIRKKIVDNPKFTGRFGDPLNLDGYNFVMAQWGRLIRSFAKDPERGWSKSPIARMISRQTDRLTKTKEKPVTSASLRIAAVAVDPTQQPNVSANTAPPPPPPPNPNVQQQNAIKQNMNGLNTAQPAAPDDEDVAGQPKLPTIPPEIPGVNHTASEETMPVETKQASKRTTVDERIRQRRFARKFATLRRIAEEEPQEVAEALTQLVDSFEGLATKLENLEDHLDVSEVPKEASIRQKVAHRNTFARGLKRLAAEEPQEVENALNDFYAELNSVVGDVETLAENLGVTLVIPEESDIDSITFKETPEEAEVKEETVVGEPAAEETENPLGEHLDD